MSLHWSKTEDVLTNTSEVDIWSRYLFHSNPFADCKNMGGLKLFQSFTFNL